MHQIQSWSICLQKQLPIPTASWQGMFLQRWARRILQFFLSHIWVAMRESRSLPRSICFCSLHRILQMASAAVRRREEADEAKWECKDVEANGRGRKRTAPESEEMPSRPPTALEFLCQQLPPPEAKPRKREDKKFRRTQEDTTSEIDVKTVQKKPKRKTKVTNVPSSMHFNYLKELLEKSDGPNFGGPRWAWAQTAWLMFERAEDAETLYNDFNVGEISGASIYQRFQKGSLRPEAWRVLHRPFTSKASLWNPLGRDALIQDEGRRRKELCWKLCVLVLGSHFSTRLSSADRWHSWRALTIGPQGVLECCMTKQGPEQRCEACGLFCCSFVKHELAPHRGLRIQKMGLRLDKRINLNSCFAQLMEEHKAVEKEKGHPC